MTGREGEGREREGVGGPGLVRLGVGYLLVMRGMDAPASLFVQLSTSFCLDAGLRHRQL